MAAAGGPTLARRLAMDLAMTPGYKCVVTRVGIGQLRDHVSRYVRRAEKGETIVIVNRDREVAVLQPWRGRTRRAGRLLGALKGTARVTGDIVAPTHDEADWFRTADRLIAATARVHDLTLLTQDRGLRASRELKTLW